MEITALPKGLSEQRCPKLKNYLCCHDLQQSITLSTLMDLSKYPLDKLLHIEAANLVVLISAFTVPPVRHWWIILPAFAWLLGLIAEQYAGMQNFRNHWSTLTQQVEYLSAIRPKV